MKVLFLIEGWISPAPRYRVLQYLPALTEAGIAYQVRALHGHRYPKIHYWPLLGKAYKAAVRSRRFFQDVKEFDVVFQQRLTLPFTSVVERRIARRNPNFVFDFDDPLFQTEDGGEGPRSTFESVVSLAKHVVAGTDYLAGRAGAPGKTTVIPTIIDTDTYVPHHMEKEGLTIGWMGTAGNYKNFEAILPALRNVLNRFPHVGLKIVSDRPPSFSLPNMAFVRWSGVQEVTDLQSFDIGLMPLDDTAWNRGKCAFKLIQYMAVGLPVIAGAVGANNHVVVHEKSGFLSNDAAGWEAALTRLIEDPDLRCEMGSFGRTRCEGHFSLTSQKGTFIKVLERAANN